MDLTFRWFACLCFERNLIEPSAFAALRRSAKVNEDAGEYGELMLGAGIIPNRVLLQALLDEARTLAESGEALPFDPFAQPDEAAADAPAHAVNPPREPPLTQPSAQPPVQKPTHQAQPQPVVEKPAAIPTPAPKRTSMPGAGTAVVDVGGVTAAMPDFSALKGADNAHLRKTMIALLRQVSADGASDLHLSAGSRPFVRRDRENHYLDAEPLSADVAERLNHVLLSESQGSEFARHQDLDFALPFSTGERFRANLMVHKDGCAGTYRTVPSKVRSLAELGFRKPETIDKLLSYHNGLILVAGPVGSGKTTTLAALVHQLNETRDDHLIAVEEPIEFVHLPNRCIITQRGVGQHTENFHSALKGALRQDPDIIVIGEMRDLETIEMAISASETGHLVIGTMHTSDAATTLNRLLDVFPPAQQSQIRAMVAESLRGIICQRLLPAKGGGLVLASEVLVRNTAVSSLIREGKTQGLGNVMETGKSEGMVAMDTSVLELWREGRLSDEVALANIRSEIARREIRKPVPTATPSTTEPATPEAPKKRGLFNLKR